MSDGSVLLDGLSEGALWRLEEICNRFETAWLAGERPRSEDCLTGLEGAERLAVLRELLRLDIHYRRRSGEEVRPEEYGTRFPDAGTILSEIFSRENEASQSNIDCRHEPEQGLASPTVDHVPMVVNGVVPLARAHDSAGIYSSRYQRLRFHAKGNLGEVYVAEDLELHREVALKEMQPQHARREAPRGRFVLEAEVTGRLEHPGIVPVYGLGAYPDGRPYYAMRFIRGDTLAYAIAQFHGRTPVQFSSLEFRQILGRFVAVCQAVAYAHGQGVLHRDLKPANIMLGEFGETLVVDWGLAKIIDRRGASEPGPAEEASPGSSAGGGVETAAGTLIGTPVFMSPEQAAGKVAELSPATDIYGLGATLYALLTGQAAFQGPLVEVLQKVGRGEWLPARRVNSAVPATLEAICAKAMALRPEERYASAVALAKDLERWLADEPVEVYREPAGARLRRWMRKHPRKVSGAGVMLLALIVGLTAGAILLEQSNREAEENFRITREATQKLLVAVNEEDLLNEPGMQPLRMKLLVEALGYYTLFLKKRPGDPVTRQERANANRQLGEVYGEKGRIIEAVPKVQQALTEYLELRQSAPTDTSLQRGLAQAYLALADLHVRAGQPARGQEDVDLAIQQLEILSKERRDDPVLLNLLGRAYDIRASAQSQTGHLDEALDDTAKAGKIYWRGHFVLHQEYRGQPSGQIRHPGASEEPHKHFSEAYLVFNAWLNQGMLQKRAGRNAAAVRSLTTAARSARWLHSKYPFIEIYHPRLARLRIGLGIALLNVGQVDIELGRPGAGQAALMEALQLARGFLQAPSPTVSAEHKAIYSQALGSAGEDLFRSGQTIRAAELLREADVAATELANANGDSIGVTLRRQRGHLLAVLGRTEGERGNLDVGLRYCEQARQELTRAIQEARWDRVLRSECLQTREAIARLRFLLGQHGLDGWVREQRQILAERKDLARQDPLLPYFQREVGASAAVLAGLLLETGQARAAVAIVEEMLPHHERLVRADRLAARLLVKEKHLPKKNTDPRMRAIALDKWALPDDFADRQPLHEPEDFQLRRVWAELLAHLGAARARCGQDAAAAASVCQAIALTEELVQGDVSFAFLPSSSASLWPLVALQVSRREPCYLYDLACQLALASTLPGSAGQPEPAARAVQALHQYRAAGFDNPYKLRTDTRLLPLRHRDDFQKLVLDLEAKLQARGG